MAVFPCTIAVTLLVTNIISFHNILQAIDFFIISCFVVGKHKWHFKMKQFLYFLLTTIVLFSCGQQPENNKTDSKKTNNIVNTISTDTSELGRYLDISFYKPLKVKFKYAYIDNSRQIGNQFIHKPSYYKLEAVLYFDSLTFDKIMTGYVFSGSPAPNFDKKDFDFNWLDKNIKIELNRSDIGYKGSPDYLFGSNRNGGLWFFKEGILVYKTSN